MRRHWAFGAKANLGVCLLVALARHATGQAAQERDFRPLLEEGFALHQEAKYAEAIPLLEKARRLEPRDYFANLLLGIDLLRTGKAVDSIHYLQDAALANPDEDTPDEYLGEAQAGLGHFSGAAGAYMDAVRRGKKSEESLLAWSGFALERFRQIGEELRGSEAGIAAVRRLQEEATRPVATLKCSGTIPDLEKSLQGLRLMTEAGIEVRHGLSLCYAIEADRAATDLNANAKDQAALHRLRGDVLLRLSNEAAGAVAEYKQAISIRGNDPALYERLAEGQMSAGDQEAARQSATEAIEIDPHRIGAMGTLATLAMNNRDYEQALPWLEKLKAESPRDRGVQVDLAKALSQTGKPTEALVNLKGALAAGYPDEKGALHSLEAKLLRETGHDAEAAKAAQEAKQLSDAFQRHSQGAMTGKSNED
jgi:predicted Zn-dependent protease